MDGISENKNREKYKMFFGITKFLYDNNIKKKSIRECNRFYFFHHHLEGALRCH
ncbi:hypothetical protein H8Z82_05725 [Blautia sp. M29]|uniref:Uncharacterized protein n=1 Tax=Blautia difficilis TaxID=2763027 RepID=A0ABR7IGK7_9FIRM|nr:hypothetical protein [Blautia difficilis]